MLPFLTVVEKDFLAVNQLIIEKLESNVTLVENIGHYLIDAGGKRLRPILVLLCANTLHESQPDNQHLELAAIIEFIHTATLLHDDVVDVSELRRGRPTANAEWGNAPSVLVGDFLYSRAFQMMVAIGNMEIMAILSDTTNMISEGEVQQLVNAKDPSVNEENYFDVIHKKTAILFEAACTTAATLRNSDATIKDALRAYGYHLGMAFQLVDDVLDYQGDAATLGKNVGDDLAEGKPTLPLIHAMKHGSAAQASLIANALRAGDTSKLNDIVNIVNKLGSLTYTADLAKYHSKAAQDALSTLPDNIYTQAMQELAQFAVERCH